jgi:predicted transcriptional regulator
MLKLNLLRILEELTSRREIGPAPTFGEIHVMEVIELLGSESPVGRFKLSQRLKIGEGSARTILKHLRVKGLVEGTRKGYMLTKKGMKIYGFLREHIYGPLELPQTNLAFGEYNVAFLVRKAAGAVRMGLEQRDAAVRAGSLGALTLVYKGGKLTMPGVEEGYGEDLSKVQKLLSEKIGLREDDVVVIGVGRSKRSAELGAKAALLETLRRLKG